MKKTVFLLASLFVMACGIQSVKAQTSANVNANATATIVTPIAITHVKDLNFGNIVATNAGTVTVGTDDSRSSTGVTLVDLPSATNAVNAAEFTVTGLAGATYTISLPTSSVPITHTDGATTMNVDIFTSSPNGTGTLAGNGTQTLKVGATLNVAANQTAGYYTGPFEVIVAYN